MPFRQEAKKLIFCSCHKMQILCSVGRCSCKEADVPCTEMCHKGDQDNHDRCSRYQESNYSSKLYSSEVEDNICACLNSLSFKNSSVTKKQQKKISLNIKSDSDEEQDASSSILNEYKKKNFDFIKQKIMSQKENLRKQIKKFRNHNLPEYENQAIDQSGQNILANEKISNLKAIKTEDSGNCLYLAISISLLGNGSICDDLRVLSAYILLQNEISFKNNILRKGKIEKTSLYMTSNGPLTLFVQRRTLEKKYLSMSIFLCE